MSLTAFAIYSSIVGLLASWATVAASLLTAIESPYALIALFLGVFLPFCAAVWSHPRKEVDGTTVSVSWREVFKSAPPWASALAVASLLAMLAFVAVVPEFMSAGEVSFELTRADFAGRPDRVRLAAAACGAFYAVSLHVALAARNLRASMGLPWMVP